MIPIYHLTTLAQWDRVKDEAEYRADSLDREGFIHTSTAAQVEGSANRYYAGEPAIMVLKLNPSKINPPVKWEESSHSPDPFPHIFGPLNLNAVSDVMPWHKGEDGRFHWPPTAGPDPSKADA